MDKKNNDNKNNGGNNNRAYGGKFTLASLSKERGAGAAYSAAAILPTFLSLVFLIVISSLGLDKGENHVNSDWYLYASYLIAPVSFALICAAFFTRGKVKLSSVAGKCKPKYYCMALLMQIGLFSLSSLNELFLAFLERAFGYESAEILLPSLGGFGLAGVIFAVAVLPAVFEELVFRGLLLLGLKGFGETFAVLVCGALFSLYHKNPAQTAYQFVCGAAFALVAIRSGSVLPTVLSHFINNAAIIVLYRFGLSEIPNPWSAVLIAVSAVCLAASLLWIFLFDGRKQTDLTVNATDLTSETAGLTSKNGEKPSKRDFFLYAAVGIAVCAVTWISSFFPAG